MTEAAGEGRAARRSPEGSGRHHPVLLLHGQPGSRRDWEPVIAAIGDRAETIAIDRPGWDGRTSPGGLQHSANAAVRAITGVGSGGAVVVVGLSYGGAVAAWLAAERPELVAALVLVSPAANLASLQPIDRLLAAPLVGELMSATLLSTAGLALSSRWVRSRFARSFEVPDDYLRWTARRLRGPLSWHAFLVEQRALLRDLPVLEERLGMISAPTTVVLGTADPIVPVEAGRRLVRQIPHAALVEIDGAHHILPAEHPARLAELIVAAASGAEHRPVPG